VTEVTLFGVADALSKERALVETAGRAGRAGLARSMLAGGTGPEIAVSAAPVLEDKVDRGLVHS